jgi:hypothetical protein
MKQQKKCYLVTLDGLLSILRKKCNDAGGTKRWGNKQRPKLSFGYICTVLRKDAPPAERILKALKAKEVKRYILLDEGEDYPVDVKLMPFDMRFEDIE